MVCMVGRYGGIHSGGMGGMVGRYGGFHVG